MNRYIALAKEGLTGEIDYFYYIQNKNINHTFQQIWF
ncbi:hypothetical protein ACVWYG_003788 [Pedobacter sp. UYEF25]